MTMRMLIDARHQEETRVAVIKGNRIEEFDFESAEHKQLKGNIYLAKVTRVEPSLQAAFVDYGGNRHGFLAFSEIHPDYYQIPKEDREALLREEAEHAAEEERLRAAEFEREDEGEVVEAEDEPIEAETVTADEVEGEAEEGEEEAAPPPAAEEAESASEESAAETLRRKRQNLRRRYKIQDVIRRRQVLLVQVVKEERGNKGAALTTYLSLAGRYCVLMPNTSHGGGISRKISNGSDRKRLKQIMADLNLPTTMGLIVRTAGLQRTKVEIKRDFDYLARLWDEIRENTLKSSAPALIYQDSDLIKRAIRDIYNKDIDEVIVEGDGGYRDARSFMKLLMPSHVRRVKQYVDPVPLFQRFGAEDQLSAMYQPVVQLKSGGYIVINPTEALVSIDINSGRSTREHNIEQTAYATNIEAAHEIARQLRLRDMAGLVVIDFIDMESNGHIRKVEKAMKESLKNDRARIQVGRISSFGLMEMSRQRLRTGVLEASTKPCPHCEGTGLMRTASSAGLSALRMLEDEAARGRGSIIRLRAGREAAIYVLNRKRDEIVEIERRYGVAIEIVIEEAFEGARMAVESMGPPPAERPRPAPVALIEAEDEDEEIVEEEAEDEEEEEAEAAADRPREDREERGDARRRRRRRGRRGGRRRDREGEGDASAEPVEAEDAAEEAVAEAAPAPVPAEDVTEEAPRKSRRRPRARKRDEAAETAEPVEDVPAAPEPVVAAPEPAPEKPKRSRRKKAEPAVEAAPVEAEAAPAEPVPAAANDSGPPPRRRRTKAAAAAPTASEAPDSDTAPPESADEEGSQSPRRGWWQRTFGA
ncbi:ribonuclease E/G [Sphingosinicella sp. LHD-64]|uniref:Rne/Rng family ribonuclease n=1 Tax=Sphingosinicella sp. LHD-64 TaxID=3072139 RepID=UPI002810708E|nr:ribonuclease E/G [Sphingosinicella sp. LHD-64]MDQ8755749.1 ribonuclease E/G [Sphingosinicella sp. LHD-64]